jgi:hypothetical protein
VQGAWLGIWYIYVGHIVLGVGYAMKWLGCRESGQGKWSSGLGRSAGRKAEGA